MTEQEKDSAASADPQPSATEKPDTAAAKDKAQGAASAKPKTRKRSGAPGGAGRFFSTLLMLLALLGALAALGGNYYLWQLNQQQAGALKAARSEQQQRLSSLEGADGRLQGRLGQVDESLARLQRRDTALEDAQANLFKQLGRDRSAWTLDEVDYLLVIANRRLQLEGDVRSALIALGEADARLKAQADPALLPVREAIASELQALRAMPEVDIEGLSLELASLAEHVATLPLPGDVPQQFKREAAQPEKKKVSNWRELPGAIWNDIKSLVSIRNTGVEAVPLRVPEQRYFLRQNLVLKLQSARLAALRQSEALYQASLAEALAWTGQYFHTEDAATQGFMEALSRLQGRILKPERPAIDGSLRTLRQVRERLAREARAADASGDETS